MVAKADTVDPFQREHFARGAVPVDRRHAEVGILARVLRHLGSAAASSRKSISIATERASVATASTGRSLLRFR